VVENAVVAIAIDQPTFGQVRVSNGLKKKGILISPSGALSVWLRQDREVMKKRLNALEAKSAQDGFALTEAQVVALEKAKLEKEAHGEIDEYQLYLAIENIDRTKTRARPPQANGICEHFHRTILQEFYQVALSRGKLR